MEKVRCHLCENPAEFVHWGLATFGIEYPGETRFICATCIRKIKGPPHVQPRRQGDVVEPTQSQGS